MFNDIKVGFISARSSIKRGNKKTTFFIIFVLALIFMNLVFLPSLINGMMGMFVGFVQDYAYGNIVIEPSEKNSFINNADLDLAKIRSINGVTGAAKRLEAGGSLRYKQKVVGANILGVIPADEEKVSKFPYIVKYGEFLGELSRDEILLGSMIAGTSTGSQIYDSFEGLEIGSIINVTYSNGVQRQYKVRGIVEGNFELPDLGALVHYKELESVLGVEGKSKASSILVRINAEGEEPEIKQKMIDLGIKEKVFTWQEKAEALIKQALQSIGAFGIMSKVISLVIGAALILIIIYINILNRKKEIGILKAVGISQSSVIISYVFLSLFYVTFGIILGLVMFFGMTLYLQVKPLQFYGTLLIYPEIDFSLLFQSVCSMAGMAVIAGFLPAWLVARQNILEAIWGR